LNCEDDEGNQLWRITCIKEQVVDYIKILKKNGFLGQEFHYDVETFNKNQLEKKKISE